MSGGILSAFGVILRVAKNVSDKGVAKGALETLEDKNIQLLKADGSMMRIMGKYIVEPVAIVSDDLKGVEELDSILGLHMDMFTSHYMQVFEILRDHYGIGVSTAIDTLATDNGGLARVITKGLEAGITLSGESHFDNIDFLGDMLRAADLSTEAASYSEVYDAELAKKNAATVHESEVREKLRKIPAEQRAAYLNRDIVRDSARLADSRKDLLIPNAIQRTIEITTEVMIPEPGSDGVFHTRKIIVPITIKLGVIFTSKENIIKAIDNKSDEYSFSSRLDEYRSGAISLVDFVLASDLINKYKHDKLKDKDALSKLISSRELSANSKMLTNGFAGFEKYYNMYLISPEAKSAIEKTIGDKLSSNKGRDKFLERSNGLSVTIVDQDYERIQIAVRDTHGKTDLSFRNAVKKDKSNSDYSEIIKALMASKAPAF